jgi:hypothetical protein
VGPTVVRPTVVRPAVVGPSFSSGVVAATALVDAGATLEIVGMSFLYENGYVI